jgi:hypothetical protein
MHSRKFGRGSVTRRISAMRVRSSASAQADYISGQNLQLDGGSYVGLI